MPGGNAFLIFLILILIHKKYASRISMYSSRYISYLTSQNNTWSVTVDHNTALISKQIIRADQLDQLRFS